MHFAVRESPGEVRTEEIPGGRRLKAGQQNEDKTD